MARILIADDDAEMRDLLGTLLGEHELHFAVDGRAALATLDGDVDLDLAILDWMMPGLDGTSVTELVRAPESSNRDLPIVLMSARGGVEARDRSYRAGADSFVEKPFKAQDMAALVQLHVLEAA